jgi:hypothetical protein
MQMHVAFEVSWRNPTAGCHRREGTFATSLHDIPRDVELPAYAWPAEGSTPSEQIVHTRGHLGYTPAFVLFEAVPIALLPGSRWKSPAAGSTNCGSPDLLPLPDTVVIEF